MLPASQMPLVQYPLALPEFLSAQVSTKTTLDKISKHGNDDIRHHWGQYSPYFDSHGEISNEVPSGCNVTFVQLLARHGSRYPTAQKSRIYKDLFSRFLPHVPESALKGKYSFLANYSYDLGQDDLTEVGHLELTQLGLDTYERYSSLIEKNDTATPFVRAAGSQRVIHSASLFAQVLRLARLDQLPPEAVRDSVPDLEVLVISESEHMNNTLNTGGCKNLKRPKNSEIARKAQKTFSDQFILPIAERINKDLQLKGSHKLSAIETVWLMDICAFDTVAIRHPFPPSQRTSDGTGISPFCKLFSDNDFRTYDYQASLGKYYGFSVGNPLGPSVGVGFVNELIARLTEKPVKDYTSTNSTLDRDPKTFPIGKDKNGRHHRLFMDFSHDNTIAAVHAAIGLFGNPEDTHHDLPVDKIKDSSANGETHGDTDDTVFSAGASLSFGSRTIVEKMNCENHNEEMVRIIVNGQVMRLKKCQGDSLGRCKLSKFLDSLSWARSGGYYHRCFD